MRLIDADDLFARMENYTDLCAEMEIDGLKALKKYLDIQPTAYDIDKVIEEIEANGRNTDICISKVKAIEIVKAGVKNE